MHAESQRLILQDWSSNAGNTKGRFICVAFRLARLSVRSTGLMSIAGKVYLVLYKVMIEWVMGTELPLRSNVGPGLRIFHGQALVIHSDVTIGANVILRHSTTIGLKNSVGDVKVPRIGAGVDIGSNSVILGDVNIGDYSIIGAGSVVLSSCERNSVLVGNPARTLTPRKDTGNV